jgi:hypothetical protein
MDLEHFRPSSERLAEALGEAPRQWWKRGEVEAAVGFLTTPAPPPFTIALSSRSMAAGTGR